MHRGIKDLTGQSFGRLVVIKMATFRQNGKVTWECRCNCGKIANVQSCHLISKHTKSCGCLQKDISNNQIRNYRKSLIDSNKHGGRWNGIGDLYGSYFGGLKAGAKRRNIEFDVSKEYLWDLFIAQDRKCSLTKLPLEMGYKSQTASLDRIDSSKGYVKTNLQWVHRDINTMKMDFDNETFIRYCKLIIENHEKEHS